MGIGVSQRCPAVHELAVDMEHTGGSSLRRRGTLPWDRADALSPGHRVLASHTKIVGAWWACNADRQSSAVAEASGR